MNKLLMLISISLTFVLSTGCKTEGRDTGTGSGSDYNNSNPGTSETDSAALDVKTLPKRGDFILKLAEPLKPELKQNIIDQSFRIRIAQVMEYGENSSTPELAENIYGGPDFSPIEGNGGIWMTQQFVVEISEDQQTLILDRPLRFSPTKENKWGGVRISIRDTRATWESEEIGVENLTLEMPSTQWLDHFGMEGQGGIDILSDNSWVRNVHLINADNGIEVDKGTYNNTVSGITLSGNRVPRRSGPVNWRYDAYGHHGVTLRGREHVLNDFELKVSFTPSFGKQKSAWELRGRRCADCIEIRHIKFFEVELA